MDIGQLRSTAPVAVFLTTFVVLSRSSPTGFHTDFNAITDNVLRNRNHSAEAKHERYIRGERAVVITQRLPDMKVR